MTTEEIKRQYSMRDIVARYGFIPNRAGFISCPFHKGDREASMKVYERDFHCFGCGKNGDIFTFVMLMDGLSFKESFRELGGEYENNFSARVKAYRMQKQREMQKKEEEKLKRKKELNNLLIAVYMKYIDRLEPLSDAWCDCYNALQRQIYINEILNDPEECHGIIK